MVLLPVVLVATVLVGVWSCLVALRRHEPGRGLLRSLLALQLVLMVQAGVAVADLLRGESPGSAATFWGYLVLSLLLLPGALALAVEERSHYASLVLAAACLVVAVVELRLQATA